MSHTLILLRHGQSTWNQLNLFTGWYDADLTDQGEAEARAAGPDAGRGRRSRPTSCTPRVQVRAIRTAELALDEMGRLWLPVRRSWRLNERHYGALQGKDKKQTTDEFGAEQVKVWRRSYDVAAAAARRSTTSATPASIPATPTWPPTCCRPPSASRTSWPACCPTGTTTIVPDLAAGHTVLVAAHGNSLRALIKHLDGISDDDIAELNLPTGVPDPLRAGRRLRARSRPWPSTSATWATSRRPGPRPRPWPSQADRRPGLADRLGLGSGPRSGHELAGRLAGQRARAGSRGTARS